jgi:hypothetical protein
MSEPWQLQHPTGKQQQRRAGGAHAIRKYYGIPDPGFGDLREEVSGSDGETLDLLLASVGLLIAQTMGMENRVGKGAVDEFWQRALGKIQKWI